MFLSSDTELCPVIKTVTPPEAMAGMSHRYGMAAWLSGVVTG